MKLRDLFENTDIQTHIRDALDADNWRGMLVYRYRLIIQTSIGRRNRNLSRNYLITDVPAVDHTASGWHGAYKSEGEATITISQFEQLMDTSFPGSGGAYRIDYVRSGESGEVRIRPNWKRDQLNRSKHLEAMTWQEFVNMIQKTWPRGRGLRNTSDDFSE